MNRSLILRVRDDAGDVLVFEQALDDYAAPIVAQATLAAGHGGVVNLTLPDLHAIEGWCVTARAEVLRAAAFTERGET